MPNSPDSYLPNASDEDLFKIGPGLHSIEGVVKVTPLKFSIDISKGLYSGDFLWEGLLRS